MSAVTKTSEQFVYRSLREHELASYYDFLTDVFSFKPAPRSLFVRHVETDPYTDLDTIYIAEDVSHGNCLAGTARTFKRELIAQAQGAERLRFGGIGEGGSPNIIDTCSRHFLCGGDSVHPVDSDNKLASNTDRMRFRFDGAGVDTNTQTTRL